MPNAFTQSGRNPLVWLSIISFLVTFIFIAKQVPDLGLRSSLAVVPNALIYLVFLGIILTWGYLIWRQHTTLESTLSYITRSLAFFLPTTFLLLYGVSASSQFHFVFQIGSGLLLILTIGLLLFSYFRKQPRPLEEPVTVKEWFTRQGKANILAIIFFTALFFSFANYRLGQYAAVDEPLWLYGRISKYWNNIQEQEWAKTDVSDKPGITVSIISGAGLLRYDPNEFDDKRSQGEVFVSKDPQGMESFFYTFRLPLVLVITFLLPLVYFFLERLLGKKNALFSYAFLTTSPILIGVAKIINPDALLWLFTTLSLLSYLVFQKRSWYRYLLLSGLFLGLALLTKYIANIIFIYMLALLFLEYLYHPLQSQKSLPQYIKSTFLNMALVIFTALSVFYFLLPANWPEPQELVKSTILSQAFEKVFPLFIAIVVLLLLDQTLNNSKVTAFILNKVSHVKEWLARAISIIFLGSIAFTIWNTLASMKVYNFMELIASPKTIERRSDVIGIFLTNFYPLIFSLTPVALVSLIIAALFIFKRKFYENDSLRFTFYVLIFTLVYYLGATVNGVGSIIRYQIIIFPLVALASGLGIAALVSLIQERYQNRTQYLYPFAILIVTGTGIFTLLTTQFPLSYASSLLPHRYYVDLKDMGPGSYEIAMKLNELPDAENILIWTDKDGVCQFFLGRCKRGNGKEALTDKSVDYVVISSARESRTTGMIFNRYDDDNLDAIVPVHEYYDTAVPADFSIFINDRPSHYVKAYRYPGSPAVAQ